MVVSEPFQEYFLQEIRHRVFLPDCQDHELEWHRDKCDREITILESGGWKFQMDNEIPIELSNGQILCIPKNTFHRVIRGSGELHIKILEDI